MYGLREEFAYLECAECKCLQIVEPPADMSKYYPGDYYSFSEYDGRKFKGWRGTLKKHQISHAVLGGNIFKGMLKYVSQRKLFPVLKGLGLTKETSVLDVGCGNGRNFLYPLAEIGFKKLMGCDPFLPKELNYANGVQVKSCDIFGIDGSWDLITYHHAFEHLLNPKENLKKVAQLLTPEGSCVIRIPTVSSFAWKNYGTNWVQLDAPRHIFLHSVESMNLLAQEAGMEVYKVIYDSNHFQFVGSEKYIKDIPLSAPKDRGLVASLRRKIQNFKYQTRAKRLNRDGLGDQAAFFLRKK